MYLIHQVRVTLSTLSFYCNRPTVVAALNLVTAITADVQPKKDEGGKDDEQDEQEETKDKDRKGKNELSEECDKEKGGDEKDSASTSAMADGVVTTINPQVVDDVDEHGNPMIADEEKDSVVKGLLGKGKDRVVFMLVLDMELAEIVLNKEDGSLLSTLSQDNFHTDVKVFVVLYSYSFRMDPPFLKSFFTCQQPSQQHMVTTLLYQCCKICMLCRR